MHSRMRRRGFLILTDQASTIYPEIHVVVIPVILILYVAAGTGTYQRNTFKVPSQALKQKQGKSDKNKAKKTKKTNTRKVR